MDTVFVVVIMGSSYKTGVAPRTQIRVMFDLSSEVSSFIDS